jgi:host factor-I protein
VRISPLAAAACDRYFMHLPVDLGKRGLFLGNLLFLICLEEVIVNRKLIRTTLADVKARREQAQQRDRANGNAQRGGPPQPRPPQQQPSSMQVRKRQPPPNETHAEIYYYKKQIDAHTLMVLVLQDGEEIEGTIEWYDRGALKINRKSAPNLLVLKRNIKYIYKADERVPQMSRVEDDIEEPEEALPHVFES